MMNIVILNLYLFTSYLFCVCNIKIGNKTFSIQIPLIMLLWVDTTVISIELILKNHLSSHEFLTFHTLISIKTCYFKFNTKVELVHICNFQNR